MQITWTEPALRDLAAVRAYIAGDNPSAAARRIALVVQVAGNLIRFPNIGRPGARELVVAGTPYLLPYRIAADRLEILRVLHGRHRWPDHFD